MGLLTKAKRTYERGGITELVRAGRRALARAIYPGPLPATKIVRVPTAPPPPPPPPPPPATHSADTVSHDDALAWFARRRPTYVKLAKAVAPYVDNEGVMLDVGANIGYFTKVLGEMLDFHGTMHLFEPIPHLVELCRLTTADLPFRSVVHDYGLSDTNETVDIFVAVSGNLGWNTIIGEMTQDGMTKQQISLRTFHATDLDAPPTFVKIDVEGAEYKVLRGMLDAIRQWSPRPTILCEIGWGTGHPAWDEELAVFAELDKLGYRVVGLDGATLDIEQTSNTTDVIFVPEHLHHLLPNPQPATGNAAAPSSGDSQSPASEQR